MVNGKPVEKDKKGGWKADSKKRDTENIKLAEDITEYFEREVLPHIPQLSNKQPGAWIDHEKTPNWL